MSGLFGILDIGKSGLLSAQRAIDITSHNLANAATPGYARQRAGMAAISTTGGDQIARGLGVRVGSVIQLRDYYLDRQVETEISAQGRLHGLHFGLSRLDSILSQVNGDRVSSALGEFFNSFSQLSTDPASTTLRLNAREAGDTLAREIRSLSSSLIATRDDADDRVGSLVDRTNTLAGEVAALNQQIAIARAAGSEPNDLVDDRQRLVEELVGIVDIDRVTDADGNMTLLVAGGKPLVEGGLARALVATPDSALDGMKRIDFDDGNGNRSEITDRLQGGELAGLVDVRDNHLTPYLADLDRLAFNLVYQVNQLHRAGIDLNGNTGNDFFSDLGTPPTTVAGAAAAISIDPGLTDLTTLAAGLTGEAGDNQVANQIAALATTAVTFYNDGDPLGAPTGSTTTISESYREWLAEIGAAASTVKRQLETQSSVVEQTMARRESTSGVSVDEESIQLLQLQRLFQASASIIKAADEALVTILNLGI